MQTRKKVLIGQLGAHGDCLYATTIARQVKHDYPDCHLTWAVGTICRSILDANPYVDDIWEIPLANRTEMNDVWYSFEREARHLLAKGEYDEVILTQIQPGNLQNFDGTVRASILRAYPSRLTVPVTPVVRLSANEVARVKRFLEANNIPEDGRIVLVECIGYSAQSFVTPDFAKEFARKLLVNEPNVYVMLSSHMTIESDHPRIIDASCLSFKENAELSKYCSLLVGCSSGISWLCTSDWAKPLPQIQLLKKGTSVYASMVHDHEYFNLPTGHLIEMTDCTSETVANCVQTILSHGFKVARNQYHTIIPLRFEFYGDFLFSNLLSRRVSSLLNYRKALLSIWVTLKRYGINYNLIKNIAKVLVKTAAQYMPSLASCKSLAKRAVANIAASCGYEIRRIRPLSEQPNIDIGLQQPIRNSIQSALNQIKDIGFVAATVIDIGAANGTKPLCDAFPKAHHVLIEPLIENKPQLEKLVNELESAELIIAAAGIKSGSATLHVHLDLDGSSLYLEREGGGVNGRPREVPLISIDEIVNCRQLSTPWLIKIDVQGAELDVLRGATESLKEAEVVILEVTFFDYFVGAGQFHEVVLFMSERGFVVYDIVDPLYRPIDNALSQVDIFFVKNEGMFRKRHIYATVEQRAKQDRVFIDGR